MPFPIPLLPPTINSLSRLNTSHNDTPPLRRIFHPLLRVNCFIYISMRFLRESKSTTFSQKIPLSKHLEGQFDVIQWSAKDLSFKFSGCGYPAPRRCPHIIGAVRPDNTSPEMNEMRLSRRHTTLLMRSDVMHQLVESPRGDLPNPPD